MSESDQTDGIRILLDAARMELAKALGVDKSNSHGAWSWDELIERVADLAVTDCAPASQAEQMIWQLAEALGIPEPTPTTWSAMLDDVRTLANPAGVAKREVCEVSRTIGGTSYACTLTMGHDGHHRQDGEQGASWPNHAGSCDARCGYFELPRGCAVVDTQRLASLRAELTALGKHVEDVERRAYASPTNDALTVELGHNINAPPGQIITTGERLDSLERRVSDNTDALVFWQGAVNRSTAKVDALYVRIAKLEEREQEALERRVAALVVDPPHMRLRRPLSASSDAPVAEPLDLATLRVPGQATGVSETAVSFRPAGHALDIVTEVRVLPGYGSEERHEWVTVGPSEARLLARALTQWADEKEAKPGPSPRAYEPDSEDGS